MTTNLVVTTKFLAAHPDVVPNLLKGLDSSIDLITSDPTQAEQLVSEGIEAVNGQDARDLARSRRRSRASRSRSTRSHRRCKTDAAVSAKALGFIDSTDLKNIYDLTLLNKMLTAQGKAAITP